MGITAQDLEVLLKQNQLDLSLEERNRLCVAYDTWRQSLDRRLFLSGIEESEEVANTHPSHEIWSS